MRKPKVVIVVDGGVVQDVLSDIPVEYVIIDYDTQDSDEDNPKIANIPQGDGKSELAYVGGAEASVMPTRTAELFKAAGFHHLSSR